MHSLKLSVHCSLSLVLSFVLILCVPKLLTIGAIGVISSIKHGHRCGRNDLKQHLEEEGEVTHKLGVIAPVHERYVEDESGKDEHHCVKVLDLGLLDDGRRHEVTGNDHNQYWNDDWNFVGPWVVWFSITHNYQRQHRTTVEDPGREAEEIDQRVDGAVQDHRTGNQ